MEKCCIGLWVGSTFLLLIRGNDELEIWAVRCRQHWVRGNRVVADHLQNFTAYEIRKCSLQGAGVGNPGYCPDLIERRNGNEYSACT